MDTVTFLPTLFQGFWNTKNSSTVSWEQVFQFITGGSLREDTDRHRWFRSHGDTDEANKTKQRFMSITPAVECMGGRRNDQVKGYTGVSMVDFDHVPDMASTLDLLRNDPYTFMLYTTLSGEGIRVFYKYAYEGTVDEKVYARAFEQGNRYFAKLTGLEFDPACKNPARLSALCHDSNAYYNPQANEYLLLPGGRNAGDGMMKEEKNGVADTSSASPSKPAVKPAKKDAPVKAKASQTKKRKAAPKPRETEDDGGCTTDDDYEKKKRLKLAVTLAARSLSRQGIIYKPGTRNKYIMRMGYQLNKYGIPKEDATQWALKKFSDYDGDVTGIIASCYRQELEHGTFAGRLQKAETAKKVTNADIQRYLVTAADYRYNVTTDMVEIKWPHSDKFDCLIDRDAKELWRMTNQHFGVNCINLQTIYNFLGSKLVKPYNPYIEFLFHLPKWDRTDYIGQLCSMVHLEGKHVLDFKEVMTRFLVAMVKGIIEPGKSNQQVLVFVGMQGIYKTSFFRILSPPEWQRGSLTKVDNNFLDKDDMIAMAECPLIIMDEVDNLKPNTLNKFKAMVTMDYIDVRAPYKHHSEKRQRIASFCGTANNEQFLFDDTGNRRFIPFCVKSIDNVFEKKIDYARLYSQVMHLYRHGHLSYFKPEEVNLIEQHNLRFMKVNPTEELILRQFRKPLKGEEHLMKMLYATEICNHISVHGRVQYDPNLVGKVMKKLGFESNRDWRGVKYLVIEIQETDIQAKAKDEAQSFVALKDTSEKLPPRVDEMLF